MTKPSANLLDENKFWSLIEKTILPHGTSLNEQGALLKTEFESLTEDELIGCYYLFSQFSNVSYRGDLWAVAYIVMGGCSDDGFDYFRSWLITRGQKVFRQALRDPDSLCDEFDQIADGDVPEFEDAIYLIHRVFEARTGKNFYEEWDRYDDQEAILPAIDLQWDEDDEASIQAICPRTFAKWHDNGRF